MRRRAAVPMLSVLAALACFAPASAQEGKGKKKRTGAPEKPFLWQVEGNGLKAPVFLFGTIHLPDDRVTGLSPVVEAALDRCDALYAELPADPASMQGLAPKLMLADGKRLSTLLPEDVAARCNAILKARGLQLAMLDQLKIWALSQQLLLLDYMQAQMMGKQGLDTIVYMRAKNAQKEVGGVETADEQLGVFDAFSDEEQITMLRQTLDGLEKAAKEKKRPTDDLVEAYVGGDEAKLIEVSNEDMEAGENKELNDKFRKLLLDDRNKTMADRVDEKLKADPSRSILFAFGTAHFPGKGGVIELLEAKGYKVRRLTQADAAKLNKR